MCVTPWLTTIQTNRPVAAFWALLVATSSEKIKYIITTPPAAVSLSADKRFNYTLKGFPYLCSCIMRGMPAFLFCGVACF